jgi:hypothetical protein
MDERGVETRAVAFVRAAAPSGEQVCDSPGDARAVCVAATMRFLYEGPAGGLPPALSCDAPVSSGNSLWERHG